MIREPYTYAILRYRHDAIAGEQINIGVILYAPKSGYLGSKFKKALSRITKVFPTASGSALRHDIRQIERAFAKITKNGQTNDLLSRDMNALSFGHKVVAADDSSLVWSEMGAGVTADPDKTLENLHQRFIGQYDEETVHRRADSDIWKPFRDKLLERKIEGIFKKKVIRSPRNEVEFEHAWKNGKWHCIQPLSFDLTTEEGVQDKAARWVGTLVGLSKGTENFKTYFLVGEPTDKKMLPAYKRALEFLHDAPLDPEIIPESEMDNLADRLADKIHASH
ncbi:DUF3037 domain-containing protein [Nitratireductor kimnyeongensis]|uniref:DUF3037 domain-containing protein n=1 Tax=Nitratireductor kimnyeongensis TaxID=430679 RepID=A0ABW0T7M2_9HYPH|nr:DUF3037 domain-containing protein [Nitratireductor kimnyeongensis]QZZ34259.1 DUF3037 domain-containing protein [Nitratireductor kimnyeongensis]